MDDTTESQNCLVLGNEGNSLIQVPGSINEYLRPYQREGVQFLYSRYRQNAGAILADDMGLGKTIQSIAFISAILRKSDCTDGRATPPFLQTLDGSAPAPVRPPPVLVICPAAVVYNWLAELHTWGSFDVGLFVRDRRSEVLRAARSRTLDVVLTSFEAARDHVIALNGPDWSAVIVDEAHRLKSMTSLVTQALSGLDCRRRIGLSGTVVQNDLREFWCLLDWANPGCLGTCDQFVDEFVRPLERGRRRGAVKRDVAVSWQKRELLATLRQQWVLRRTKALIADQLPNKTDQIVYCAPSPLQRQVYSAVLSCPDVQLLLRRSRPCDCGSHRKAARCCLKRERGPGSGAALSYMGLLLKISNHPYLLMPSGAVSEQQNSMARQVCQSVFEEYPELASLSRMQAFRALSDPKYCGKMKVLITLIEHFREKSQKVLIFSYSTRMLKIIRAYVSNQGFELTYIDGDTAPAERPRLCQEFSRRPQWGVALVSTRAGGQGLNIVGATAVIVFDPSWNPAHDLQAQDRAYRLGQTRDVSVYRLISTGTIEENIYLRQVYKQQLSTLALEDGAGPRLFSASAGRGGHPGELFGLHNLLQLRDDARLTEQLLDRHRRVEQLLTRAAGREMAGALPEVHAGVAGLPVSDYTAVAPSDGEQVLPSDEEAEQLTPAGGRGADEPAQPAASSVDDALRGCDVQHVHGNAGLVGASRMEEHVARQAARAVFELGAGTQEPAERCAPLIQQAGSSGVSRPKAGRPLVRRSPGRGRAADQTARVPVLVPTDHSRLRAAGSRVGRRLPAALMEQQPPAGPSRRRRTPGSGQGSSSGRHRSAAGQGQREGRRRTDMGRHRTHRDRRPQNRRTSPEGERGEPRLGTPVRAPASSSLENGHRRTAAEREDPDPVRTVSVSSEDSVIAVTQGVSVSPVVTAPPAADRGREPGSPSHPSPSGGVNRALSPAAGGTDSAEPSSPTRPPPAGSAMDDLLDRLLASPGRRPPPARRPRPRPAGRPRPESDLISRWLRDGKVSIVE